MKSLQHHPDKEQTEEIRKTNKNHRGVPGVPVAFAESLEDKDNPLAPVLFQQVKFGTFWAAPAVASGRCDPGLKGLCSLNR